jgi:uncharacterized protein YbjT (DUF2867 family)
MATILVTGGTGTLGRDVVSQLLAIPHEVRVLSRRPRPDTATPHLCRSGNWPGPGWRPPSAAAQ